MTTVQDTDGVDWHLEVYDLARDILRLRYTAKSGDRIATAAVVALADVAHALGSGRRPMCLSCSFRFGGFRRPAGVVGAIKCDIADAALAGALCHYCLAARPQAELLDALLDRGKACANAIPQLMARAATKCHNTNTVNWSHAATDIGDQMERAMTRQAQAAFAAVVRSRLPQD